MSPLGYFKKFSWNWRHLIHIFCNLFCVRFVIFMLKMFSWNLKFCVQYRLMGSEKKRYLESATTRHFFITIVMRRTFFCGVWNYMNGGWINLICSSADRPFLLFRLKWKCWSEIHIVYTEMSTLLFFFFFFFLSFFLFFFTSFVFARRTIQRRMENGWCNAKSLHHLAMIYSTIHALTQSHSHTHSRNSHRETDKMLKWAAARHYNPSFIICIFLVQQNIFFHYINIIKCLTVKEGA